MKRFLLILTAIIMAISMGACAKKPQSDEEPTRIFNIDEEDIKDEDTKEKEPYKDDALNDLMKNIVANAENVTEPDDTFANGQLTLAKKLIETCYKDGENIFISPLSLSMALGMTANGANGNTKDEIVNAICNGVTLEQLNSYIGGLIKDNDKSLKIANSIWLNKGTLNVEKSFLQKNADFYKASLYEAPFTQKTASSINNWVSYNTDKMIPNIVDELSAQDVMILINALCFDATWEKTYDESQVSVGKFTSAKGEEQSVMYLNSTDSYHYEDGNCKGIVKYYRNSKYAFTAFLPDEGKTVSDCINGFEGNVLDKVTHGKAIISLPKFKTDYSVSLVEALKKMGVTSAFSSDTADFTGIDKTAPLWIGSVIQKTHIEVDEKGTKAAAATSVTMKATAAYDDSEPIVLEFNRPFVYMIVDTESGTPIFTGIQNSIGE